MITRVCDPVTIRSAEASEQETYTPLLSIHKIAITNTVLFQPALYGLAGEISTPKREPNIEREGGKAYLPRGRSASYERFDIHIGLYDGSEKIQEAK